MAADPGDPDDLAAARAAMAATRRSLSGRLDALRDRLVALVPDPNPERTDTVPPKTAKPAASKAKSAKPPAAAPAAKKPAGPKKAEGKSAPARAIGTKAKTGTARKKTPTLAQAALREVKEVAADVLTGAAAGAVRGAAQAAVGHAEEGAEAVDRLAGEADARAPKKPAKGKPAKGKSAGAKG